MAIAQMKFTFNRSMNKTIDYGPFQIIYRLNPSSVLDLIPINFRGRSSAEAKDLAADLQAIHESVKQLIEASNTKYKKAVNKHKNVTFEVGDYVWAVLTKD